jgi:hypothetical protein
MTSAQALDDAEVRRNNAQSDLVAARSREATAASSCAAPRCARPSTAWSASARPRRATRRRWARNWLKVIDPRSMRFEGLVSADRMQRTAARAGGELPRQRLCPGPVSRARCAVWTLRPTPPRARWRWWWTSTTQRGAAGGGPVRRRPHADRWPAGADAAEGALVRAGEVRPTSGAWPAARF